MLLDDSAENVPLYCEEMVKNRVAEEDCANGRSIERVDN
jgi:hypothetical protein